jgi:GTPase KRas
MRDAEGFIVVYSVTDRKSFEKVVEFQKKITQVKEKIKQVPILLIGNKIDLKDQRQVKKEEGEKLAKDFGIPFLETSAKSRVNIDECFETICLEVRKWRIQEKNEKFKKSDSKKDGCLLQ